MSSGVRGFPSWPGASAPIRGLIHWCETTDSSLTIFPCNARRVHTFQAIHDCGVGITRGLVLVFGIGARPFQHGIRGQGGTIFGATLPDDRSKRTCELTSSVVPRGTSFHRVVELEVSSYRI